MKRAIFAAAACLTMLLAAPDLSMAEEAGPRQEGFEIGYRLISFDYDEPDITEEGLLHGVFAEYTHRFDNPVMLALEAEYYSGELDYDGEYQNGAPLETDTDDYIFQVRGLAGWDFDYAGWTLTPYAGLGWRYWNDDINAAGGYEREIRYFYAPLGFEAATVPAEKWIIGFSGEYDLFLDGQVEAHLSDVGPGYEDASLDQNFAEGYGVRISAYARHSFERFFVRLEPFFRYWDIQESDTDTAAVPGGTATWVEPENDTTIFGASLSVGF
jgi:hypothetical protein